MAAKEELNWITSYIKARLFLIRPKILYIRQISVGMKKDKKYEYEEFQELNL